MICLQYFCQPYLCFFCSESKDLAEENPKTSPETQECEIIDEKHSSISNDDIIFERVVEKTLPELYGECPKNEPFL